MHFFLVVFAFSLAFENRRLRLLEGFVLLGMVGLLRYCSR